jgi:hypothetical protein
MDGNDAKHVLVDLLLRAEKRYGKRAHKVDFDVDEKEDGPIMVEFHNSSLTKATIVVTTLFRVINPA